MSSFFSKKKRVVPFGTTLLLLLLINETRGNVRRQPKILFHLLQLL